MPGAENPNEVRAANLLQNQPYSVTRLVAEGSPILANNSNAVATFMLDRYIQKEIIDTAPEPWMDALKLLFSKAPIGSPSLTFEYVEQGLGIAPIVAATTALAGATDATQSFTLTTDTQLRVGLDDVITYPNGTTQGTVTALSGVNITVTPFLGEALPAVAVGDVFATGQGQARGDAMDRIASVSRSTNTKFYNYIQTIGRFKRWGTDEMQEWENMQRVNYVQKEMTNLTRDIRFNMFAAFLAGNRGIALLSGGEEALRTGGVYSQMVAAGAGNDTIPQASLPAAFKYHAFNTRFKGSGSTRLVIARSEVLHLLQEAFKETLRRYTNDDTNIKLDINQITIGGVNYVLVPCDILGDGGMFDATWRTRILCLDMDNINVRTFNGKPYMHVENPLATNTLMQGDGSLRDYKYFGVFAKFGVQHEHAKASFALNIADL